MYNSIKSISSMISFSASGGTDARGGRKGVKIEDSSIKNYFSSFPEEVRIQEAFGNGYVINKPMAAVGGDGYWLYENSTYSFLVVFDCMGHGRFASMMTRYYLRAIHEVIINRKVTIPANILYALHKIVAEEYAKKDGGQLGTGADMGVLVFNKKDRTINYAGAKMDLVEVDDDGARRIKGDRKSIGEYFDQKREYATHTIGLPAVPLSKYYMYSDGVTDLFGGPKNKKLGYKNLAQLLEEAYELPTMAEKDFMNKKLNYWEGSNEPLDDRLIVSLSLAI